MRYWAFINNEIRGPFEKEALVSMKEFSGALLLCQEGGQSGQAADWKPASSFPEVMSAKPAAPAPAPQAPKPAAPAAESPLALTMRGSLILDPETEQAAIKPASASPAPAAPVAVNRSVFEAPAKSAGGAAQPELLAGKLDQIGAMLLSVSNGQTQLLSKMTKLETELAALKALIVPPPPKAK